MGLYGMQEWGVNERDSCRIVIGRTWEKPMNCDLLGIALYRMNDMIFSNTGYKWQLLQQHVDAVRALAIPFTRIYDIYGETWGQQEGSETAFNESMNALCYILEMFGIRRTSCSICYSRRDDSASYPESSSESVLSSRMISATDRGFYWHEVDNEPYSKAWGGASRWTYDSAGQQDYCIYQNYAYSRVSNARRLARVGVAVQANHLGGVYWGSDMINSSAVNFHWVHSHWYHQVFGNTLQDALHPNLLRMISRLKSLYDNVNNKYGVNTGAKLGLTEWGIEWSNSAPDGYGAYYSGNIAGCAALTGLLVHIQDYMPYLAFMCVWALFGYHASHGMHRFLTPKSYQDSRGYLYWLYYMLRRWWGDYQLSVSGSEPVLSLPDSDGWVRTGLVVPVLASFKQSRSSILVIAPNLSVTSEYEFRLLLPEWYPIDWRAYLFWRPSVMESGFLQTRDMPTGYLIRRLSMKWIDGQLVTRIPPLGIIFAEIRV